MPFVRFHSRFPEIAELETRTVRTLRDSAALPAAEYAFVESFCDERGCDCRRVFFTVFSSRSHAMEAVIAYGWESREFYRKWLHYGSSSDIASLRGPILSELSPQSKNAPAILDLFRTMLMPDKAYVERVKGHYRLFRSTVDNSQTP